MIGGRRGRIPPRRQVGSDHEAPRTAMRLLGGFLQSLGTRGVGLAAAAIGSVVTARALGPEGKGAVVILGTLAATLAQIGTLGLTAANVHFGAREHDQIPRLVGVSGWVAVAMGGGLCALVLAAAGWRSDIFPGVPWPLLVVTVVSVPFSLGSQLFQSLLLGLEAIRAYNGVELLRMGLGLAGILCLFLLHQLSVTSVVLLSAVLAALVCAMTLWTLGRQAQLSWSWDEEVWREALTYGMLFFINNLLAYLLLKSDLFLVNHFLGLEAVGIYSVAVQIADLLLLAPATLGMLLFPRLSGIPAPAERARTCLQFARLTAAGMAAACFLAGCAGPLLIPLVLGAPFQPAWIPLALLLPGVWLLALENVLIMHLAAHRLPLTVPGLWLGGLALNVGLNVWLLPRLGVSAAALTSTVAYAVVSLGVFCLFRRETGSGLSEVMVPRRVDWDKLVHRLHEGGVSA